MAIVILEVFRPLISQRMFRDNTELAECQLAYSLQERRHQCRGLAVRACRVRAKSLRVEQRTEVSESRRVRTHLFDSSRRYNSGDSRR
jgi:hypothetical protein